MKAMIELDVPEWQIGQEVTVYFPDTMRKDGVCRQLEQREAKEAKYVGGMMALHCGNVRNAKIMWICSMKANR